MIKMRLLALLAVTNFIVGGTVALAHDARSNKPKDAVNAMTGTEKKDSQKKKAAMCADCDKPESECKCDGHMNKSSQEPKKNGDHQH